MSNVICHMSNVNVNANDCSIVPHCQPSTAVATSDPRTPHTEVGNDCEDFDQYGWTQVRGVAGC